jgi:hypothetical protein
VFIAAISTSETLSFATREVQVTRVFVRLSQLYCVSREAKRSFDTLRALEYFLRCLRIWSKDFDEILDVEDNFNVF